MPRILDKLKSRVRKITGRMDRYQEAITFAEAGQISHAQQMAHEKEYHQSPGKLLVKPTSAEPCRMAVLPAA